MNTDSHPKIERPHVTHSDAAHVVIDPDLSVHEKLVALNSLEQDARQLATAAAEGMPGGEESKLRDVLAAKRAITEPPVDAAFDVVSRTFEARLRETLGTEAHVLISRAIEAIKAARDAIAAHEAARAVPPGVPEPGSPEELQEELDKEKLDPGG